MVAATKERSKRGAGARGKGAHHAAPLEPGAELFQVVGDMRVLPGAMVVDIGRLVPMLNQPRTEFDQEAIDGLAKNMRELKERGGGIAGTGLLQALSVRYEPGAIDEDGFVRPEARLIINGGETRYRAAQVAGLTELPVTLVDVPEGEAYELALMENIHRKDLGPMDEARAIRHIMNSRGLSIRKVATHLGKTPGYVQNRLDMLKLSEDVQVIIDERPDSLTIAQRINRVSDAKARRTLIKAARAGAPAAEVLDLIKRHREDSKPETGEGSTPAEETTNGATGSSGSGLGVIGTPAPKGVPVVPRADATLALDAALRQLEDALRTMRGAPVVRSQFRAKVAPRLERVSKIVSQIEELGAPVHKPGA